MTYSPLPSIYFKGVTPLDLRVADRFWSYLQRHHLPTACWDLVATNTGVQLAPSFPISLPAGPASLPSAPLLSSLHLLLLCSLLLELDKSEITLGPRQSPLLQGNSFVVSWCFLSLCNSSNNRTHSYWNKGL